MLLDDLDRVVPASETFLCAMSDDNRQDERIDGPLPGAMKYTGHDSEVEIRNLSARGAMAEGIFDIAIGQSVSVRIGSGAWIRARVAWAISPRCGLEFESALDPALAHDSNWVT